jgi:hypothetical protein
VIGYPHSAPRALQASPVTAVMSIRLRIVVIALLGSIKIFLHKYCARTARRASTPPLHKLIAKRAQLGEWVM